MMKRIWYVVLSLALCLTLAPAARAAVVASGYCGDPNVNGGEDVTWSLDDAGTLTISGEGDMAENYFSNPPWYSHRDAIKNLIVQSGVTSISAYAFSGYESLANVTLFSGIARIGNQAFLYCYKLNSITVPNTVTSIGYRAFCGCTSCPAIYVDDANPAYRDIDGVLFDREAKTLLCYPAGRSGAYVIPKTVTSVANYAFDSATALTSIEIPNGVVSIGKSAFNNCIKLSSILIPPSVSYIGEEALACGYGLQEINVESANAAYQSVDGVLLDKEGKSLITFPQGRRGEYIIPYGIINISDYAFYICQFLTSVFIPDSVSHIGAWAFLNCRRLTDVYYSGSEAEWNAISIGDYNDPLLNATVHYNSEASAASTAITSLTLSGGSVKATVYVAAGVSGARAVCAQYDGNGRLLGAATRSLTAGQDNGLTFAANAAGATAKIFVLDSSFAPLCTGRGCALK